ncbi:MAG: hypothetical protein IPI42_08685 [Saprospiraceae bacterium]|nr:hypothetical protein [Candidatus Parvibacillus calidus]
MFPTSQKQLCSTQGVLWVGSYADLCSMYFKSVVRINPATGQLAGYYQLVESYRNANDRVCTGRCSTSDLDLTPDQMVEIQEA